jgi:putative ABC transport system permease protein
MDTPPAGELSMCGGIEIPGRPVPEDAPPVCLNFAGPRFFETMGIPVLAGRDFQSGDDAHAQQRVVISESVARRYFGDDDPLGRQILAGGAVPGTRVPASIIGVVKDVRYTSLRAEPPLMIYRPSRQESSAPADTLLIRTSPLAADALMPLLRAEIRAAAPGLPPPTVVRLEDRVAAALVEERMLATLSATIGVLTALLAAMGIYSTAAAAVARRRSEIGIRMALGARPGEVARMVVGEAFAVVGVGLAIGLPAAIAAALAGRALLAGVLFQLSPTDPLNLFSVAIAVLVIAPLAAYAPARRASRIDPLAAIKHQQ